MDEIEEESRLAAEKMVMNMMQRPGQLEKVSIYIRNQQNKEDELTKFRKVKYIVLFGFFLTLWYHSLPRPSPSLILFH